MKPRGVPSGEMDQGTDLTMKDLQRPKLCLEFLGWQCRVRQDAVRRQAGRPPKGIRAEVIMDGRSIGQITTILNRLDPGRYTAEFRFMTQKTQESQAVYDNALAVLGEYYYQIPAEFDDRVTALFSLDSSLAEHLLGSGGCELQFLQGNRKYVLVCSVRKCEVGSEEYEATYWHNRLFNPNLPGMVRVLRFEPDWNRSGTELLEE